MRTTAPVSQLSALDSKTEFISARTLDAFTDSIHQLRERRGIGKLAFCDLDGGIHVRAGLLGQREALFDQKFDGAHVYLQCWARGG
jgi:hypothetical protein